jgi:glycerophosphoryl diester phosphodiesterase
LAAGILLGFQMLNSPCAAQNIVGHRGASHDAPENTLTAFRLAWEQGVDGIEADFQLTSDGRLICMHDKDFQRVSGDQRKVQQLTFEEARQMDVGEWKGAKFKGERAPSLAEVLGSVPEDKLVFVELKGGKEIVAPLVQELAGIELAPNQIVIIAFDSGAIAECKRRRPDLRCHWLTSFEHRNGQWTPTPEEVARKVKACGADGVGLKNERAVLTDSFLRDSGVTEFHVWTVNKPDDAAYFQRLGAWGITTNRPGWLREQLKTHSH